MEVPSDLPNGPSGRSPLRVIDILDFQSKDSTSLLVLFDDGTLGKWDDNGMATSDGSEYTMIFHSNEQFGNINIKKYDSIKEKLFLKLQLAIYILSLILYIFIRNNSLLPSFFPSEYSWIIILIFIPYFFFWWAVTNLFTYTDGEIVIHLINSDPHYFTTLSNSFNFVQTIISNIFIIQLICLYYGYFEVNTTILSDIAVLLLSLFLILNKYSLKPIGEINDFINTFKNLNEDIKKQNRIEYPLLSLLMSSESNKLEFKASLWTQYIATSSKVALNQEKKFLKLEDSVVKTIAAFLNAEGGQLLIGVQDPPRDVEPGFIANVLGIEPDYKWLKKNRQDTEGYHHELLNIFTNAYSNKLAVSKNINITFPCYENKIICKIDVSPLNRLKDNECYTNVKMETEYGKKELFFVRIADTSRNMSPSTMVGYIRDTFDHPYR